MRSFLFSVLAAAAAALTAASVPAPAHQRARRQVSIPAPSPVPSECTSTCGPVNDKISLGCPVTGCCTTDFETQYYNCLECVGSAAHAANYSTEQNSLDLLYTTCVDIGFVLPRMELPGQTNSSLASGPSSAHATGAAARLRWRDTPAQVLFGSLVLLGIAVSQW